MVRRQEDDRVHVELKLFTLRLIKEGGGCGLRLYILSLKEVMDEGDATESR